MPYDLNHSSAAKDVCLALMKDGLISDLQTEEILKNKDIIQERLELQQAELKASSPYGNKILTPITIIDIINHLNLARDDNASLKLDEEVIFQALATDWHIPFKKIDPLKLDLALVTSIIPRSFAMKHLVLPIAIKDKELTVATCNPFNQEVMEDIARASQLNIKPVLSSKSDIIKFINEFFGFRRSIAAAEHQFTGPAVDLGNLERYVQLQSSEELPSNDQHIVNAVNHLFSYAFDQRASDIHIEPKRETSQVRMRIDGVLHTVYELPKNVHAAIVTRIKTLSSLDVSEKRRPQDGRIKAEKGSMEAEIRLSTIPVAFGEKVVMRIMDPDILFQDLETLGFSATDLIRYNQFINMPHGMILVCGPTGSGKSTTLYSSLRHISSSEINITTIEDPIEMIHQDFNQIAVQPAVGITFSTILRNILRQDPDVIMIGEMRDLETAENAVQAALTGHLVLSTLHTNDAPSSIIRLIDLGVPPFLVQATVVGIVAQRLVRKICNHCKEPFEITAPELRAMGFKVNKAGRFKLYQGKGCQKCRGTGYLGRTSIFEVLPFSEKIKKLIGEGADLGAIRAQTKKEGMITLRENAVKKLQQGITTHQEVLRVTWEKVL